MEEVDTRPQLDAGVYQSIELENYEIHKRCLASLKELQVLPARDTGAAIWPQDPGRLSAVIGEYARALFDAEAKHYPQNENRNRWLRELAGRIEAMMARRIWDQDLVSAAKLTYHASREEIDGLMHAALHSYVDALIAPPPIPFPAPVAVESLANLAAAAGVSAPPVSRISSHRETLAPVTAPDPSFVAMQIRSLRREARLTVEELADKVGVASRTVQRHEAGEVGEIRLRHLRQYERVFGSLLKRPIRIEDYSDAARRNPVSDIA